MSRCLVIQHVAPESAFTIEEALVRAGVGVDTCRIFAGDAPPDGAAGLDGLVVMGGPMSAASDHGFPTRPAELTLIADAVSAGIPTLGVCLGAQLVAAAHGALVYPGQFGQEIGWSAVTLAEACQDDQLFAGLPERLTVLQWHGDTFNLPDDARLLMSNARYPNQAFRIGDAAWGVQFHFEVTEEAVDGFLHAFAPDAVAVEGGVEQIRADTPGALAALGSVRHLVLSRFAGLVTARVTSGDLVHGG